MVHLEDFMVNLSRYKLSPINYKPQHQLVWSAPEWMDSKRHSRDFSPGATLFRYCLTWFRLKEEDYKVVTTVISSFQNERQASHYKFNIFHRWALTLPVPLGTWSHERYEGRGHLTETGSLKKNISCLFNIGLNRKICFLKFPDYEWKALRSTGRLV